MPNACKKAVTYLAENSGVLAALVQQQILTGSPNYALSRIPEAKYNTGIGHNPRYVRVRTTPPRRVAYQPMLPQGNQAYSVANPQTGELTSVQGDKTGRGCALPAETIQYGYDVRNRCLKGKAIEAGPWCIMDLLEKEAFKPLLQQIWKDLPRYGKEDFGRQLLRDVIEYSYSKYSIGDGFPTSTQQPYFPAVPTGGPSIGFLRRIESLMVAQGWSEGADTPMINGRRSIQVQMSREAIEWAISRRKTELGLTLDSRYTEDDKTFGKTVIYEGIQLIEAETPTRGYLLPVGGGSFEFVEIEPTIITTADGEGFWPIPNPEFYASHVSVGGQRLRVCEIGYIIHKRAMERQSLGAIPSVPGKTFNRNFDFEVEPIPDYELADRGCNKDGFWFGYRMLHAYAPLPKNPELMTAFIYLAPTNRYETVDPWNDISEPVLSPTSMAPLNDPKASSCVPCDGIAGDEARDPTDPTCTDLFPANGVGVIRWKQSAYEVSEDGVTITVVAERIGGSVGAATVVTTTAEGTATSPENFSPSVGSAGAGPWTKTLSWTDGQYGPKTLVIPINGAVGDDDGKQFTVTLSAPTGATLGSVTVTTVTILDADEVV
jgi:hypothetical protein